MATIYNDYSDSDIGKVSYDWLRDSREADQDWREFSKKTFDYYLGKQWAAADKAIMDETKRAALTINEQRALIKLVSGYQRQNRYPIRVYGSEASDEPTASTLEELIQNIIVSQLYIYQDSQRFLHSAVSGRGYMFGKMDYSEDWLGEITLHSRINPRHVYFDRMSKDIGLLDAEYIIWVELMREQALHHLIGDKDVAKEKINYLRSIDWEGDFEPEDWPITGRNQWVREHGKDRFWMQKKGGIVPAGAFYKVMNVFYRTWDNEYFLADKMSGQLKPIGSRDEGERIVQALPNDVMIVQRQVRKIKSALVCGDMAIDHKEVTTGHKIFPLIPYFAGYFLGETFGLLHDLMDVQDFLNKRFSNYSHILNTTANPGWIGDEDAVKDWAEFKKEASKPGPIIKKRTGKQLERLDAGNVPASETRGLNDATELIKIVSGVNPDMIGQADKDTSGRAIMLRQQQGYQILAENIDNHRLSTVLTTQWMIDAIQGNYNYEKTFRVIMPDNQVKYLTINQQIPNMIGAIEKVLNDVSIGKYDVVVSDQAISPSMRYLHFQELIEIVRETGVGIPPQVLVKASNLPQDMKVEILQALVTPMSGGPAGTAGMGPGKPGEVPQIPEPAMA